MKQKDTLEQILSNFWPNVLEIRHHTGFEKNTQDFDFYGLLFALFAQRVLNVLFIWTMFRLLALVS